MPTSRAASSRDRPSSALASASKRALTRPSCSRRAARPPRGRAGGRVGGRGQGGAARPVMLGGGEPPQLGGVAVGADRQRGGHGGFSENNAPATPQKRV